MNSFNVGLVDNIDLGTNLDGMDQFGGILGSSSTNIEIENTYYGGGCGAIGGVDGSDTDGATYSPTIGNDAQTEEWYSNSSLWNPDYPWNIGEDWFIVDGYPTLEEPITWLDDPSYYDYTTLVETGDGSASKPFVIKTNKQLAGMAYLLREHNADYKTKHFKLAANVDMSEYYWVPIGTSNTAAFAGHFDGGNYTISGLKTIVGWDGAGLFGTVIGTKASHAVIENVVIKDCAISAGEYTGGVVGVGEYVEIINCSVIGENNVLKGSKTGGVIGYALNSEIKDSYNGGTITASGDYLGGVVGYANLSQVENCHSTAKAIFSATITGVFNNADSGYVGGIIGGAESSTIANCFSAGETNGSWGITINELNGTPLSGLSTGGIIGFAKTQAIITGCYNLGLVSCDIIANGGGIAGKSDGATIQNCYNKGSLISTTYIEGGIMSFGGIVGSPANSTIFKCTNYGKIDYYYGYAGGIAGMVVDFLFIQLGGDIDAFLANLTTTTIENCYNYGSIKTVGAGGIICVAIKCDILNCVNFGDVGFYDNVEGFGSESAAGIVGLANDTTLLDGCYNIGKITARYCPAGIVAMVGEFVVNESNLTLNHCFNAGDLVVSQTIDGPSSDQPFGAGLVGNVDGDLTITNSAAVCDVIDANGVGAVLGVGAVYEVRSTGKVEIKNCFFKLGFDSTAPQCQSMSYGVAFEIEANEIVFENCAIYNEYNLSGGDSELPTPEDIKLLSFVMGTNANPDEFIKNCYAIGEVHVNGVSTTYLSVYDNGGLDGNFVYQEGMFGGMAVPVNLYHIDDYITSTGILTYLQQTFNVQPYAAA